MKECLIKNVIGLILLQLLLVKSLVGGGFRFRLIYGSSFILVLVYDHIKGHVCINHSGCISIGTVCGVFLSIYLISVQYVAQYTI